MGLNKSGLFFFFSSRRRHTRCSRDWSSDVCSSDLDVILCERGIRGFDTATRNVFDLTAIPVVHKLSHLPIIADPSHGTGLRDKVIPMARAAVAAGADGIMVEVHPNPEEALSDGAQTLYPEQFTQLMREVRIIAEAIGRRVAEPAAVGA